MESTSGASVQTNPAHLSVEDLAKCKRAARNEGLFAGLTSAFLSGLIGNRLMRFDRNKTIFCGILTGALSGYFFTQAFLNSRIAEAAAQQILLRKNFESNLTEPIPNDGGTNASAD